MEGTTVHPELTSKQMGQICEFVVFELARLQT